MHLSALTGKKLRMCLSPAATASVNSMMSSMQVRCADTLRQRKTRQQARPCYMARYYAYQLGMCGSGSEAACAASWQGIFEASCSGSTQPAMAHASVKKPAVNVC